MSEDSWPRRFTCLRGPPGVFRRVQALPAGREAQRIRDALGALPGDQRQIIELAVFGGCTQTGVAKRFELPLAAVKRRARAGLLQLRDGIRGQLESARE
ncbi:MAG: sigma factor-like helix-turn-helix DNA-binding protein [Solirubrobacteraceae bacterium]